MSRHPFWQGEVKPGLVLGSTKPSCPTLAQLPKSSRGICFRIQGLGLASLLSLSVL